LAALGRAQASLALPSLAQHFRNGSELKLYTCLPAGRIEHISVVKAS